MSMRSGQTRRMSAIESIVNVAIGYVVAIATQVVAFPLVGVQATMQQNLGIGAIFTVVSLVRSYLVRRAFEGFAR